MTICVAVCRPCHVKFGEANAILAGDALQTLAFSILSDADMPEVSDRDRISMISELASASGIAGMCGGQGIRFRRRKANTYLWTRLSVFIVIKPAH